MNMAHIPPRFYNQHQQAMQARQQQQNPRGQNRRPPQRQKGKSPLLLILVAYEMFTKKIFCSIKHFL